MPAHVLHVCVCVATDAGSVAQSHLTREERVRDAAERERERGEEKKGGMVPGGRERAKEEAGDVLNAKQHGMRMALC